MKKNIVMIFILLVQLTVVASQAFAGYTVDQRVYFANASVRSKFPWNSVVAVDPGCTGTLVSPGYMVTAGHCITGEGPVRGKECPKYIGSVVKSRFVGADGCGIDVYGSLAVCKNEGCDKDYAIVKIDGDRSPEFKSIADKMRYPKIAKGINAFENITNIGYGALRVVSDEELIEAKNVFIDYLKYIRDSKYYPDSNRRWAKKRLDSYGNSFSILDQNNSADAVTVVNNYYDFIGKLPLTPDGKNAKVDLSCQVTNTSWIKNGFAVFSDCQVWGGNSGGPLFVYKNNDYYIAGIVTCGIRQFSKAGGGEVISTHPSEYYNDLKRICTDCRF